MKTRLTADPATKGDRYRSKTGELAAPGFFLHYTFKRPPAVIK